MNMAMDMMWDRCFLENMDIESPGPAISHTEDHLHPVQPTTEQDNSLVVANGTKHAVPATPLLTPAKPTTMLLQMKMKDKEKNLFNSSWLVDFSKTLQRITNKHSCSEMLQTSKI